MANLATNRIKKALLDLLATQTIKAVLITGAYTPNKDHSFLSSATGSEASTTGYTSGYGNSGRKTLANFVIVQDDTGDSAKISFDPVVWAAIGVGGGYNVRYMALGIETGGSDATSPMLAVLELNSGSDFALNGGSFTVTVNAAGAITIT